MSVLPHEAFEASGQRTPGPAAAEPLSGSRSGWQTRNRPRGSGYFFAAAIASSKVRRPVVGAFTSTAMLPGLCWFFHILVCAAGI